MFEIDRVEFLGLLEVLQVAVEKKKLDLMAIRGIRLKAEDGYLYMASTNLALSVKILNVPLLKYKEDLDVVVATDRLYSIVKASTVPTLKFKYKEPQIHLHANGISRINTYNVNEFPQVHVISDEDEPVLTWPISEFKEDLKKAASTVVKDAERLPHFAGVCMDGDFYATDTKRMIHVTSLGSEVDPITVVPQVSEAFSKIPMDEEGEVRVYILRKRKGIEPSAVFEFGNIRVGSQTFSEPFPIEQVLKIIKGTREAASIVAAVKREQLIEVLGRAALFEDSHATADLRFNGEKQLLEVRCIMMDKSGEEYTERLECRLTGAKRFTVTLNFRELLAILITLQDKIVRLNFSSPDKPFYLASKDKTVEFISTTLKRI